MTSAIKLNNSAKVLTFAITVILLGSALLPFIATWSLLWITITFYAVFIISWCYSPVKVEADNEGVTIVKVLGKVSIAYHDIKKVERIEKPDLTFRVFASGGFWGYFGVFRSRSLGQFKAYVGTPSNSILLQLINGDNILFSCEHPDEMISFIKMQMDDGK